MKRSRGENEGDVAFGKRGEGSEGGSEVSDLLKKEGVGDAAAGGDVDEDSGGRSGGRNERESVVGDGERLRGWRERDVRTKAMECSGLRAEARAWIDQVRHGGKTKFRLDRDRRRSPESGVSQIML